MRCGVVRKRDARHVLDFALGFGDGFAAITYVVDVLGTQGILCIQVLGVYCNGYPQAFLLNLLLHVPSDSPWAFPPRVLWWSLLSAPQGLLVMALHDASRYRRWSPDPPTRS